MTKNNMEIVECYDKNKRKLLNQIIKIFLILARKLNF